MPRQPVATFADSLAWGEDGEREVAALLLRRGVVVVPMYHLDPSTAPVAMLGDSRLVLPDLICWGPKGPFFAEVKRKRQWVAWKGRRETGCDTRHYRQYLALARATSTPAWMFFAHEHQEPTGIYCAEATALEAVERRWDGRSPAGAQVSQPLSLFPAGSLTKLT